MPLALPLLASYAVPTLLGFEAGTFAFAAIGGLASIGTSQVLGSRTT